MSEKAKSAEDVAAQLRAAYEVGHAKAAEVLTGFLADQVMILHEPRMPSDGPRAGDEMRAHRRKENPAFERAIADFTEVADITVEGDYMTVSKVMAGTRRSNGQAISERVVSKFRIADGQIVEMLAVPQSGSFSVLGEVLREGGMSA